MIARTYYVTLHKRIEDIDYADPTEIPWKLIYNSVFFFSNETYYMYVVNYDSQKKERLNDLYENNKKEKEAIIKLSKC